MAFSTAFQRNAFQNNAFQIGTDNSGAVIVIGDAIVAHRSGTPFSKKRYRAIVDEICLLYTSPSPRDRQKSRMPSSA